MNTSLQPCPTDGANSGFFLNRCSKKIEKKIGLNSQSEMFLEISHVVEFLGLRFPSIFQKFCDLFISRRFVAPVYFFGVFLKKLAMDFIPVLSTFISDFWALVNFCAVF